MPISSSPVQQNHNNVATGTLPITLTAPSVLNLFVAMVSLGGTGGSVSGITQTNVTWTRAGQNTAGRVVEIWVGVPSGTPGTTVTISSDTGGRSMAGHVSEWSGVTSVQDGAAVGASGTAVSTYATGNKTTANANDLLLAAAGTADSTFSTGPTNSFSALTGDNNSTNIEVIPAYRVVSATGTYSTAWTGVAHNYGALILALKATVAPGNTVAPVASGTTSIGSTLSVTNGTWGTGDAVVSYAYQWQRDNSGGGVYSDIASATASTYTLVSADLGCNVRCVVTATNGGGSGSANSNALGTVTGTAPANTVTPAVTGTTTVGSVLTCDGGTFTGAPTPTKTYQWQRSRKAYCVAVNGTTGYITIPDSATTRVETNGAFTVAMWAWFDSYSNNVLPRLWDKGSIYGCIMGDNTNGQYRRVALEVAASIDNGNGNGGVSEFWGKTKVQTGQWYHLVFTFDQATSPFAKLYVNGVYEPFHNIFAWSGVMVSTVGQPLYIARRPSDLARNLQGRADDFIFWQRALTPTEAVGIFTGTVPSDFAARVKMDEGTGTSAADLSANGNNATLTNASWHSDAAGRAESVDSSFIDITGATSATYTLQDMDDGVTVKCKVTATNAVGSANATSVASASIAELAPTNVDVPPIALQDGKSNPAVGTTLWAFQGGWSNVAGQASEYDFQWQTSADGATGWADIGGATATTYLCVAGDIGKYLRCKVTARNSETG